MLGSTVGAKAAAAARRSMARVARVSGLRQRSRRGSELAASMTLVKQRSGVPQSAVVPTAAVAYLREIEFSTVVSELIEYARTIAGDATGGGVGQLNTVLFTVQKLIELSSSPAHHSAVLRALELERNTDADLKEAMQCRLSELGACRMIYEQLCLGRKHEESNTMLLRTAISLLDGGNKTVQDEFRGLLRVQPAVLGEIVDRFRLAVSELHGLAEKHRETGDAREHRRSLVAHPSDDDASAHAGADGGTDLLKQTALLDRLRFVQLLCEGHNRQMQNFLRDGGGVRRPMNVVAATMDLLVELHDKISPSTMELGLRVLDTLIEFVQGPCAGNQVELVQHKVRLRPPDVFILWVASHSMLHYAGRRDRWYDPEQRHWRRAGPRTAGALHVAHDLFVRGANGWVPPHACRSAAACEGAKGDNAPRVRRLPREARGRLLRGGVQDGVWDGQRPARPQVGRHAGLWLRHLHPLSTGTAAAAAARAALCC